MMHNKKYFYKYLTAEAALKILKNQTFKYSSPVTFNDPFDTQTKLHYGFSDSEIMDAIYEKLYELIHSKNEPKGNMNNSFFREIYKTWQMEQNSTKKMTKTIWKQMTSQFTEATKDIASKYIHDMETTWEFLSNKSVIFCVAEKPTNLLMWAHYAKDHTGIVIKLQCRPELDTPLCIARKVQYSKNPPLIAEKEEYVKSIIGQLKKDNNSIFYKMFLTKSCHWKYEQEWRVFIPPESIENEVMPKKGENWEAIHKFLPFYSQELHSIYFGCKMLPDDKNRILKQVETKYNHVELYQCIKNDTKYQLDTNIM